MAKSKRRTVSRNRAAASDIRSLFPQHRKSAYLKRDVERRSDLVRQLAEAYQHKGLVLYIGAGVSRSIGLPTWPELIRTLTVRMMARKVESAIAVLQGLTDEQRWAFLYSMQGELEEQDFGDKPILMAARAIKDQMGSDLARAIGLLLYRRAARKSRISQRITGRRRSEKIQLAAPTSPLVQAIVALARAERDARGVQAIINYNFDDLLEENLRAQNVRCTTVTSGSQRIPERSLPSYHVHGLVSVQDYVEYLQSRRTRPLAARGNFVFSEDEYHAEYSDPYKWSNMTQISHLGRYIGLFVGLSLQDPNLRRLIDVTHKQYPENYNFAILPRSHALGNGGDSKQTVFRNLFEEVESQSFDKIGVRVIWVDSFEEIPSIIRGVIGDGA